MSILKKTLLVIAILVLPCLAFADDATTFPNLVGEWEGRAQYHSGLHGHVTPEPGITTPLVITSQEGPVIAGFVSWNDKHEGRDDFSGVFDMDGETFYLAGHNAGVRICKMDGPDKFIYYFMIPGTDNPAAGYAIYTRVK